MVMGSAHSSDGMEQQRRRVEEARRRAKVALRRAAEAEQRLDESRRRAVVAERRVEVLLGRMRRYELPRPQPLEEELTGRRADGLPPARPYLTAPSTTTP